MAVWYFAGDDYNCKKNLKRAEEAFAEGQLNVAEEYYEAALEYDATLKDAYKKIADLETNDHKYESAIRTLHKGLENTVEVEGATDQLLEELVEVYKRMADTGSSALEEKMKEVKEKHVDTVLDSVQEYYYDSKSQLIEYIETFRGEVFQKNYAYDDSGNVIEYIETTNGIQTRASYEWTEADGKKQCVL